MMRMMKKRIGRMRMISIKIMNKMIRLIKIRIIEQDDYDKMIRIAMVIRM